jgi:hypothetical protein
LDQSEKLGGRLVASSSLCPFKGFIDHFGLVDLGFSGNPFTWSNSRQGNDSIKERLDRGIASISWVHLHPEFALQHIPATSSDHHPILLNSAISSFVLPRPFRFEEFWTKDPTCGAVIEAVWSFPVQGSPAFCLAKKLLNTKFSLLKRNRIYFGNIQTKIKSTLAKIDQIQISLPSSSSFSEEANLKLTLDDLLLKEEILGKSKSRECWLTCTDLNTKYFHSSTIIRRRSNAINFLHSFDGVLLSDRAAIGGTFVSHFTNLFSSSSPPIEEEMLDLFTPVITEDDNILLCSIPTKIEVIKALSSLGSTKAPGPDGFTALFYKKYWPYVRKDVLACIESFFNHNHLLKEQNHTYIALVPKQNGSQSVYQFRPISLCNIVYKLISKILANRLKNLLPKIISLL